MTDTIDSRVIQLVEATTLRPVDLDEALLDSGLIDSISAVDLALELEREFNIEIPASQIHQHMRSLRTLLHYLQACPSLPDA